jgi:indolepyruvate ferredoxin oxidoreductase beta subunit
VKWQALEGRSRASPSPGGRDGGPGLRKVVEFQDLRYGREYLDRLDAVLARDEAGRDWELSREAAKHLANAIAYDDVIRVADLKTRSARFTRIAGEMGAREGRLLHVTEFMHPRAEEVVGCCPPAWARGWRRAQMDGAPRSVVLPGAAR